MFEMEIEIEDANGDSVLHEVMVDSESAIEAAAMSLTPDELAEVIAFAIDADQREALLNVLV